VVERQRLTPAERQRRHRAHKRGDHSLCDPARCGPTPATVTPPAPDVPVTRDTVTPPAGLGERGCRLWGELATTTTAPAVRVLIEEACRIADRLERLDAICRGESDVWARFSVDRDGDEVTVVIDRALSEARQQALALRQLVADIRQAAGSAGTAPGHQGSSGHQGGGRDDLASRRKARLADATGR